MFRNDDDLSSASVRRIQIIERRHPILNERRLKMIAARRVRAVDVGRTYRLFRSR